MAYTERWEITGTNEMSRRGRNKQNLNNGPAAPPPGTSPLYGNGTLTATVGRSGLVYGTYIPDGTTCGVLPGSSLSEWNDPSTDVVTFSATFPPINNKIIYGDIKNAIPGNTDVYLNNCLLVGGNHIPSTNSGVLDCNPSRTGTGRIILTDCTIAPRRPSLNRDCAVGKRFSLFRCELRDGIDCVGIFTTVAGENADVTVMGCWGHSMPYFYPDYKNGVSGAAGHTDGTHNDNVQLQGGGNVQIKGNLWEATSYLGSGSASNPSKPWLIGQGYSNGACITIQDNTGAGITGNTVVIEDNWFKGGLSQVNIKPGLAFILRNNHHYRATAQLSGTWAGYWIRLDDHTSTVTGLTSNNRWVDGPYTGNLLTEPRDLGIHYNA